MILAGWIEFLTKVQICFDTREILSPVGGSDIVKHLVNSFPLLLAVFPFGN